MGYFFISILILERKKPYTNRLNENNDSPYILWTTTVTSNPNTGSTTMVIQLSAHYKKKKKYKLEFNVLYTNKIFNSRQ